MTQPTVALVNNAQREHLEFMATVEAVARENGQVIQALGADGVAVFPSDDTYTPLWREFAGTRRVITFSDRDEAARCAGARDRVVRRRVGAESACRHWVKPAVDATRIAGRHNVRNALAATACALAAGVPLLTQWCVAWTRSSRWAAVRAPLRCA
jgi:UDP-N-acetylmuramoyl-tripeptide--D-alanyl-D-alanine ligase